MEGFFVGVDVARQGMGQKEFQRLCLKGGLYGTKPIVVMRELSYRSILKDKKGLESLGIVFNKAS